MLKFALMKTTKKLLLLLSFLSFAANAQNEYQNLPLAKVYEAVAKNNIEFDSEVVNAMEVNKGAYNRESGFSSDFLSNCTISTKNSKTWKRSISYRNKNYPIGGNPALAIAKGIIYAVCMSVEPNYNGGSLELLISKDNGENWSISNVVEIKKNGIPDKPSIAIGKQGEIYISFSQIDVSYSNQSVIAKMVAKGKILKSVDQGKNFTSLNFAPFLSEKNSNDCFSQDDFICGENTISIGMLRDELVIAWGDYAGNIFSSTYQNNTNSKIIKYGNFGYSPALIELQIDNVSSKYSISLFEAHMYSSLWIIYGYKEKYETINLSNWATMSDVRFSERSIYVFLQESSKFSNDIPIHKNMIFEISKDSLKTINKVTISETNIDNIHEFEYLGNNHAIILKEDGISVIGFNWTHSGKPSLVNWFIKL
jgi:hypothetical protein